MFKIKVVIWNCDTGRAPFKKVCDMDQAMETLRKATEWFDKRKTFFSGKPLWENWEAMKILTKFEEVARGKRDHASETIVVFKGKRSEEHQIYMEKVNGRFAGDFEEEARKKLVRLDTNELARKLEIPYELAEWLKDVVEFHIDHLYLSLKLYEKRYRKRIKRQRR